MQETPITTKASEEKHSVDATGPEESAAKKALDMDTPNAEESLLNDLIKEYGDMSPEYTEEDTEGVDFISKAGNYHGFVSILEIEPKIRKNATKTREAGSKYFNMIVELSAKEDIDGKPYAGTLRTWVYFENGNMRNYDEFCVAAKVKRHGSGEKMRRFPQADVDLGGAVRAPIGFVVKMGDKREYKKYEDVDGSRELVQQYDASGAKLYKQYPEVEYFLPWDTTEKYVAETAKVENLDIETDDF